MADNKNDNLREIVSFFKSYVSERNIKVIGKSEWETLYFYCIAKIKFNAKPLINLSASDLYALGEELKLDFSQTSVLLKKCFRLEYDEVKKMDFIQLFNENAILNLNIEGNNVKFGIANALVQERMEELFTVSDIFADTSFKKNIFVVPSDSFSKMIEDGRKNFVQTVKSNIDTIVNDVKKLLPGLLDEQKTKITQIKDAINNAGMKNIAANLLSTVSGISGLPIKDVAKLFFSQTKQNNPVQLVNV